MVKIVVSKDSFDWYLRFDGNSDEPLHCRLSGKRRNNTKVMIEGELSPAIYNSPTGCYQEWQELSSNCLLFATFLVTSEDAKAYMYSLSSKRRVHKWNDIWVNLYI